MSKKQQNLIQNLFLRRSFMKRAAILGISLLLLSGILAACGGQEPVDQPQATAEAGEEAIDSVEEEVAEPAEESISVEFWDMVWGPPEYIDTGKVLVDQFNSQSDSVVTTYQSTPWTNWYQTFLTAIGSGTAPDLSTGAGYQAVQFYDQGAILPIDDVIAELESSGQADDFLPGTIERLQYDGHTVALPWAIDIRVIYYRKDLFEQAGVSVPTNWDELREAAAALTSGDQYGMVTSGASTGGVHLLLSLMLNNGGGLFTTDGQLDFMNERNVESLTFLSDMVADGSVHPGSAGFSTDDAVKAFGSGTAAILMDGPGIEQQLPDLSENIGLMSPLAGFHGDTGTISWVNNVMIYTQSENPDAAKEFLTWWSQNQGPLWTEGNNGQIPVRISIVNDPFFQDNPFTKQIIDEWVPVGKSTAANAPGIFPALNDIEGEGVMQTLIQDILQGKDVGESMEKAAERIQTIVE